MSRSRLFLLFIAGLFIGVLLFTGKPLSIFNRLPEKIFPQSSPLTLIFTGDVMLARSVNTRIIKYADTTWPFKNIAPILSSADLTIINLESPFATGCIPTDDRMIFCADPKNVAGLVFAGVDVATLSNNHIENQGQKGIDETINILKSNNIIPVGAGLAPAQYYPPAFITVKNTKLAILAFTDLPEMDGKIMAKQIRDATSSADLVITTFHWGNEYQTTPTARQVFLAHLAIDSGADIVVGHHPHWVQTEETYLGKPIYYSLGNLVFDQMWSEETRLGEILKVTYQDKQLIKKEVIPTKIFDYGQPAVLQ
jgi:poly-gamma-glutamate synthesis protein (capsule biosynthesis protein)